jgi:glyoxylase-like metal-dependent hydrolase (beta-lactamase superfamily II)
MHYDPYLPPLCKAMPLRASVYVAPPIPWTAPSGKVGGPWSPISSTLIRTTTSAVLVDTPITEKQNAELADWVERELSATGASLDYIYITHGHGDHWFGINALKKRFPSARAIATPGVISHMRGQIEPKAFTRSWGSQFPEQIDRNFVLAEPLGPSGEFQLTDGVTSETFTMRAVEVGHADTHSSTVLWSADLKLAVAGDVVYGTVHQMLAEANTVALRREWIRAIEIVESLGPAVVVAGHKQADEIDGPWHLQNSKQYIQDFDRLVEGGEVKSARELVVRMKELYPSRFNDGALVAGAVAAFKVKEKQKQQGSTKL